MSLVGPRPIVAAEVPSYGSAFSLYTRVHPGLTGLWQVSGRNALPFRERTELDAFYVRNWSVWLDLYILLRTVRAVLGAEGALLSGSRPALVYIDAFLLRVQVSQQLRPSPPAPGRDHKGRGAA